MPAMPRAKRLNETNRASVSLLIDDIPIEALVGDTVLTAILLSTGQTGRDAFNQTKKAGFCLMGACQSCWVWTATGQRFRACETPVQQGLQIYTDGERLGW